MRPRLALLLLLFVAPPSEALTHLGSLTWPRSGWDVAVAGDTVYTAQGLDGLSIADASDPRAPREIGAVDTPGFALDVEVVGEVAFVADDESLQILDVSDPTALSPLSAFTLPGDPEFSDVEVVGTRAYLAASSSGLTIVDVGDPSSPRGLGALDTPGVARRVEVRGRTAYVADLSGLRIVDVSDPAAPREIGHLPGDWVQAVRVAGVTAWVVDGERLRVVDVSTGSAPHEVASLLLPGHASVEDIEIAGTLAFLSGGRAGLLVVDVAQPAAPRLLGSLLVGSLAVDVELAGGRAYVSDFGVGFSVVDVSQPGFPSGVGALATGSPSDDTEAVVVSNGIALVGQNAFVRVVDVSDPSAPRELARIDGLGSDPLPAGLTSGLAYVRAESGLQIFDVSDPVQPLALGQHPASLTDVEVEEGIAYLTRPDDTLELVDVSDPTAPRTLGTLGGLLLPFTVAVDRGTAYVGDILGLRLVDVRDPGAPAALGSLELPGDAIGVSLLGTRAYVVSQLFSPPDVGRLHVIDVSDPLAPVELASAPLREAPHHVAAIPGRVFVGTDAGVRVFSESEADGLVELGGHATGGPGWGLELASGLVYAASMDEGLQIIDFGPEYGQVAEIVIAPPHGRRLPRKSARLGVVTLFGSEFLVASAVDPTTLRFGPGAGAPVGRSDLGDVDRDGFPDLVTRFRWRDAGLGAGVEAACLSGRLRDGARFIGCDESETPSARTRGLGGPAR